MSQWKQIDEQMKITGIILCVLFLVGIFETAWCNPVEHLLERIMPGSAQKFELELVEGDDFFELSQKGDKVLIPSLMWTNYIQIANEEHIKLLKEKIQQLSRNSFFLESNAGEIAGKTDSGRATGATYYSFPISI